MFAYEYEDCLKRVTFQISTIYASYYSIKNTFILQVLFLFTTSTFYVFGKFFISHK